VAAGIILVISAHWDEIPRGAKIAAGLALMLGAHGAGWWLRDRSCDASSQRVPATPSSRENQTATSGISDGASPTPSATGASQLRGHYPKAGEALHFAGSLLFLGNIALVGQIYHLSSRPGNAFLLWWVGLAALPWLLRSAAQFALLLLAVGIWFGVEINDSTSLIRFDDEHQVILYALLGLVLTGFGFLLRRGGNKDFSVVAETFGLLAFSMFSYPLTWSGFLSWGHHHAELASWMVPALGMVAALLVAFGCRNLTTLSRQWRMAWGAALAGAAALLVLAQFAPQQTEWHWFGHMTPLNTVAAIAIFIYSLMQVQVGVQERSRLLVNLGVLFIALDIIATYIGLFGSMAFTGMMFIISGVFLILFAVFLEKKRRALMKQIKTNPEARP
jgi:uncharacterized membrane protein